MTHEKYGADCGIIVVQFRSKMGNYTTPTWTDSPDIAEGNKNSVSLPASSATIASQSSLPATSSSTSAGTISIPDKESVTKTHPNIIRRPSNVFRPLGVSEMEIKSYCSKIKMIVGGTKLSVGDNLNFLGAKLSSEDELKVLNCLENIVIIVELQEALPLEPSALNDLTTAVRSLQTNQPNLANQYAEIIAKARKLIEAKTMIPGIVSPASIVQAPVSGRTTPQG